MHPQAPVTIVTPVTIFWKILRACAWNSKIIKDYFHDISVGIKLKQTDWAYLAGLLDADGSFYVNRNSSRVNAPRMQINANYGAWMDICAQVQVGRFYLHKRYTQDLRRRRSTIQWIVSKRNDVLYILENIFPYLRTKKDIARRLMFAIRTNNEKYFLNQNQMTEKERCATLGIPDVPEFQYADI